MRRRRRRQQSNAGSQIASPVLIATLVVAVPLLAFVNIVLSAQVSDLGFRINELNARRDVLMDETHDLEQEIFQVSALTKIQQTADELGFESNDEYVTINTPLPVARNQE